MKKLLNLFAVSILALSVVACSTNTDTPVVTGTPDSSNNTEKTVLKVAAIETAYGKGPWEAVIDAFEKTVENVEVELVMDKSLEDVISPSMKAGNFPDVISLSLGRPAALTETFIKDENIRNLDDALQTTIPGEQKTPTDKMAGGFLDNGIVKPFDESVYLAPAFYSPCGLFYNTQLFADNGWTVPTTWDEMWTLADAAKEKGIALFTYPTTGYYDAFMYSLIYSAGGAELFNSITNYEEGIWETPEAKEVIDIVVKLASYTHETVPANANNDNFKKNQALVLTNDALFMPNGTWVVGEMAETPTADGFKWGMTAVPAIKEGSDQYSFTFFEQIWSPKASVNTELANQFIAFLYSDVAVKEFAKVGAIQPVLGVSDYLDGDNKLFYSIYENGAKAAMGAWAATDAVEGVNIADSVFGSVNSLVNKTLTKEEYVARIIEASDKLRPALK